MCASETAQEKKGNPCHINVKLIVNRRYVEQSINSEVERHLCRTNVLISRSEIFIIDQFSQVSDMSKGGHVSG